MSRRFNIKKFIKDVLNDKYALLIGNEIILDTKVEPTGDVHQYFLRKVNETTNVQYENYHEIALEKSEKINPLRRLVEEEEIRFRAEDVSNYLKNLLATKLFCSLATRSLTMPPTLSSVTFSK